MKRILVIAITAGIAAAAGVIVVRLLGFESAGAIGGAIGGAVGATVGASVGSSKSDASAESKRV